MISSGVGKTNASCLKKRGREGAGRSKALRITAWDSRKMKSAGTIVSYSVKIACIMSICKKMKKARPDYFIAGPTSGPVACCRGHA
jgi:hypothetical protein